MKPTSPSPNRAAIAPTPFQALAPVGKPVLFLPVTPTVQFLMGMDEPVRTEKRPSFGEFDALMMVSRSPVLGGTTSMALPEVVFESVELSLFPFICDSTFNVSPVELTSLKFALSFFCKIFHRHQVQIWCRLCC